MATWAQGPYSWGVVLGGDGSDDDGAAEEVHHSEADNDDDEPKNGRDCSNAAEEVHHEEPRTNVHDGSDDGDNWESRIEAEVENDSDGGGTKDCPGVRTVPRDDHSRTGGWV